MTVTSENQVGDACITGIEAASEEAVSRRSLLRSISRWSLGRRMSLAGAAVFAGIAARGSETASASNWACCTLARMDQWCGTNGGNPPFWCNHGGFKRIWYCCQPGGQFYGCGECQSSTGTCFNGPVWYCSYGWRVGLC